MKNVLSIAGSDCSAGAGIQADLKTFVANGVYGMTVITSLTAQNPQKVKMVEDVSIEMLKNQLEAILDAIEGSAIKIGMINSKENAELIYDTLLKYKVKNIVLDPIMISTSGKSLIKDETKEIVKMILNNENIENIDSAKKMQSYGKIIADFTKKWVLVKGGHLSNNAVDILLNSDETYILEGEKIPNNKTHGTGCSLSSAIASNLAKGYSMLDSVKKAKNFVLCSIKNTVDFGEIGGTVNQMGEIYKNIDIEKLY